MSRRKDMSRILVLDCTYCDQCTYVVAIGSDRYCPLSGRSVSNNDRCSVGDELDAYHEGVREDLEAKLFDAEGELDYLKEENRELEDKLREAKERINDLETDLAIERIISD